MCFTLPLGNIFFHPEKRIYIDRQTVAAIYHAVSDYLKHTFHFRHILPLNTSRLSSYFVVIKSPSQNNHAISSKGVILYVLNTGLMVTISDLGRTSWRDVFRTGISRTTWNARATRQQLPTATRVSPAGTQHVGGQSQVFKQP